MKAVVGAVLMVTAAFAAEPRLRVSAAQPWSDAMHTAYGVLPELGVGVSFERAKNLAALLEIAGSYAASRPASGNTKLWDASLRGGLEIGTGAPVGLYVTPGLQVTFAGEQFPSYDTLGGVISRRWYGGAAIGAFLNAGVLLFNAGKWHVDVEAGVDGVSVPTERNEGDVVWWGYYPYYRIDLGTLNLGLVLRWAGPSEK